MAVALAFLKQTEFNNPGAFLVRATLTGNYGTNGVGDLLNLAPYQVGTNPGGITDPNSTYDEILGTPTSAIGPFNTNLGGSTVAIKPGSPVTLTNVGLQVFEPGGAEKATGAAYTAAELAGYVDLIIEIPKYQ
jgi:hypothetical protein